MKFYMKYNGNNNYIMRVNNLLPSVGSFDFTNTTFHSIVRYTLTANQLYEAWQQTKMKWNEPGKKAEFSEQTHPEEPLLSLGEA